MTDDLNRTRLALKQAAMRSRWLVKKQEFDMAINDPEVVGEAPCICGRIAKKPHCPNCGTYDVYARGPKNDLIKMDHESGVRRRVVTFRCKRCGMFFDADDWQMGCKAPQRITQEMRRKEMAAIERPKKPPKFMDAEKLLAINKIRAMRGMEPLTQEEFDASQKGSQTETEV